MYFLTAIDINLQFDFSSTISSRTMLCIGLPYFSFIISFRLTLSLTEAYSIARYRLCDGLLAIPLLMDF